MHQGDFWFKNGMHQDLDQFVHPLDHLVTSLTLTYRNQDGSKGEKEINYTSWEGTTTHTDWSISEVATWTPYFINTDFFGQCYTLHLNQAQKITRLFLNLKSRVRILPHSPGDRGDHIPFSSTGASGING